jgi:hypothetical protein
VLVTGLFSRSGSTAGLITITELMTYLQVTELTGSGPAMAAGHPAPDADPDTYRERA